jgi:cytidyltransferase-like protein
MNTDTDTDTIVVASGYFDPIHIGHIEYLNRSKSLGKKLIVIVNNDAQACIKKGRPFMPANERVKIIRQLSMVDMAIEAVDNDKTVCETLRILHPDIFTNGGDQFSESIPERELCIKNNIKLVDGLGEKIQSSSWLIKGKDV